jgi:hypothetical protein
VNDETPILSGAEPFGGAIPEMVRGRGVLCPVPDCRAFWPVGSERVEQEAHGLFLEHCEAHDAAELAAALLESMTRETGYLSVTRPTGRWSTCAAPICSAPPHPGASACLRHIPFHPAPGAVTSWQELGLSADDDVPMYFRAIDEALEASRHAAATEEQEAVDRLVPAGIVEPWYASADVAVRAVCWRCWIADAVAPCPWHRQDGPTEPVPPGEQRRAEERERLRAATKPGPVVPTVYVTSEELEQLRAEAAAQATGPLPARGTETLFGWQVQQLPCDLGADCSCTALPPQFRCGALDITPP